MIRIAPLPDSATLVAKPLGTQQVMLVVHPDLLIQRGTPQTPEELPLHPCITLGSGGQTRPWYFLDREGRSQLLAVRGRLGLTHTEAILDAALAGQGIALLPDWLVAGHLRDDGWRACCPNPECKAFRFMRTGIRTSACLPRSGMWWTPLAERFLPEAPWDRTLEP